MSRIRKWRGRFYKTDRTKDFEHERDRNVRARQIYETIDRQRYQWMVVLVAGIGFFVDGYTLFASNIVVPMIAYVYWRDDTSSTREGIINIATLAGTMLGQVCFGFLADKYGRKKMYGAELLLLIVASMGTVMCSNGAEGSMNFYAWILWWRVIVGIGAGGDYPLSAVITSELAPTQERARMMASVFFMQPLGQVCGNLVTLVIVAISRHDSSNDLTRTFDQMWRWLVGFGIIPGVLGVILRFGMPETPRYLLEIEDDPVTAEFDASALFGESQNDTELDNMRFDDRSINGSIISNDKSSSGDSTLVASQADVNIRPVLTVTMNSSWTLSRHDLVQYFWIERNWITLVGTMLAWALLDFGFYGIALSNPKFLAKTWGSLHIIGPTPSWKTTDDLNVSVFDMFSRNSLHALLILNLGSVLGGILMIAFAPKINRVSLQKYGFLALAGLFLAMGAMFKTTHSEGAPAITLYVIGQLLFNFGPNTTTYMLPAELFPTRYRASCHGLAAGAGKFGSIVVQIVSTYYRLGSSAPGNAATQRYGVVLLVFSLIMVLGALVTHYMIPDVQEKGRGPGGFWGGETKTLEELSTGRAGKLSDVVIRARRRAVFD